MKTKRKVFRIIIWGAIGDGLVVTPIFKALKQKYSNCKIMVFCLNPTTMALYQNNPYIDSINNTSFWRSPIQFILKQFNLVQFYYTNFQHIPPSYISKKHARDIAAEIFDIEIEDKRLQVFLTPEEEKKAIDIVRQYRNPIALHITSRCSKNHTWELSRWNALVKLMPQFTFLQLGNADEDKVEGAVDLRGKTTIKEAIAVVKHAWCFAGVESSLAHAASAVNTPGVVLFGDSDPNTWAHESNINIYKPLPCSPCYNLLWGKKCPYDNACMKSITVGEVMAAINTLADATFTDNKVSSQEEIVAIAH